MDIQSFAISRLPQILFGEGCIVEVPSQVAMHGKKVLIVTGARSFRTTAYWEELLQGLHQQGIAWDSLSVSGEPSPNLIDQAVKKYRPEKIEVVLGIGGGSVLDAAKAIAGLLPYGNSVMDHLEGVGKELPYQGPALPFIAVPTTAGTGSEATKNAVLSVLGEDGFKKSFRHDCLVPQVAVVDPRLLISCPTSLIAAHGMDAFTQLLESYVSLRANSLTDALAYSGLTAFRDGFFPALKYRNPAGFSQLAYAALLSGMTLAQVGLGVVHGLASPLGAFFPCPHGEVCGTLVAEATDINIQALKQRLPQSPALFKYVHVAHLLIGEANLPQEEALKTLVHILRRWTMELKLPLLSHYGMQLEHLNKVVSHSRGGSMKTNPIPLTDDELKELLQRRL